MRWTGCGTHSLTLRADLQSRLGNDGAAVELARQALEACPEVLDAARRIRAGAARAGRYDDALAAFASEVDALEEIQARASERLEAAQALARRAQTEQGAAALQARASELAKLELWGRAFDVLAPHEAEITRAPGFAIGFAELALRAGEPDVAERVLAANKSPAEAAALIAEWTAKMGWTH